MVRQRSDTLRAAREIAKLPDAGMRSALIAQVLDRSLSTRAVREMVRDKIEQRAETAGDSPLRGAGERALPPRRAEARTNGQPTPERAVLSGAMIDRDIRNVRGIFERWQRELDMLDDPYLGRLIRFMMEEHLEQVDRLIRAMERRQ